MILMPSFIKLMFYIYFPKNLRTKIPFICVLCMLRCVHVSAFMCEYVCVHMCVSMCVCTCACVSMCVCTRVDVHVHVYACVHMSMWCVSMCVYTCEGDRKTCIVDSLLLPCEFQGLNSGHQIQWQEPFLLNHVARLKPKFILGSQNKGWECSLVGKTLV